MKVDEGLKSKILNRFKRRHCEKTFLRTNISLTFLFTFVDLTNDCILSFLFPAKTDVLVPVLSKSTDVVVVNFVVVLKFPTAIHSLSAVCREMSGQNIFQFDLNKGHVFLFIIFTKCFATYRTYVIERWLTCKNPYIRDLFANVHFFAPMNACSCYWSPMKIRKRCSYLWIGNHVHVKSSRVAPGLGNAWLPGRAKFANAPTPGLTRRGKYPTEARGVGAAGIDWCIIITLTRPALGIISLMEGGSGARRPRSNRQHSRQRIFIWRWLRNRK